MEFETGAIDKNKVNFNAEVLRRLAPTRLSTNIVAAFKKERIKLAVRASLSEAGKRPVDRLASINTAAFSPLTWSITRSSVPRVGDMPWARIDAAKRVSPTASR